MLSGLTESRSSQQPFRYIYIYTLVHLCRTTDKNGSRYKMISVQSLARWSIPCSYLFPPQLVAALEKYACVMGAKADRRSGPLTNWWRLERCIFVPREALSSGACGGLRLLQNATAVVSDPAFCDKKFGRTHCSNHPSCMQDASSMNLLSVQACNTSYSVVLSLNMCACQVTALGCRSLLSIGLQWSLPLVFPSWPVGTTAAAFVYESFGIPWQTAWCRITLGWLHALFTRDATIRTG